MLESNDVWSSSTTRIEFANEDKLENFFFLVLFFSFSHTHTPCLTLSAFHSAQGLILPIRVLISSSSSHAGACNGQVE